MVDNVSKKFFTKVVILLMAGCAEVNPNQEQIDMISIKSGIKVSNWDVQQFLQIKQFTNFDKSVWSNLKKSKNPPYFTDIDIINLFDKFISKTYIDKKLINLEPLILEFINKNLSLILSKYSVKQHNNINSAPKKLLYQIQNLGRI